MGNKHHKVDAPSTINNGPATNQMTNQQPPKMTKTEAWQILVAAQADDIKKWLDQQEDKRLALTEEVLSQQTAMQLVVGGRTSPSSDAIIESLKILIAHGADVNYIPPESTASAPLLRDPVPYLAAIHTEPEVLKFLFEQGADFRAQHPSPHMSQRTIMNQSSFINAMTVQRLLDPASIQHTLSFKQKEYPAHYRHHLAEMKLDWVHFIGDAQLKSTLVNVLQSRVITAFKVAPEDRKQTYPSHQKTEINFELALHGSEMTSVTLLYESDISCNGSEEFNLTLTMPRDCSGTEQITVAFKHSLNAFHGNDLIPDVYKEHYEEFEACLAQHMDVHTSPELCYLFVLMLLCHVDDETLVHKKGWNSNRSRVLRPSILAALRIPGVVAQLGRDWAHAQNIEKGC